MRCMPGNAKKCFLEEPSEEEEAPHPSVPTPATTWFRLAKDKHFYMDFQMSN